MVAQCASPIKARVARMIKLDACGVPITGAESAVVTFKGFVSIAASPQYEEGTEFIQKNANGDLCVNALDDPALKRINLETQWCTLDPDALVMATGQTLLGPGNPITGTGMDIAEGISDTHFSLELWQPVSGVNACLNGVQQWVYWVFPHVGVAMIGDFTFENGVFLFTTSGSTKTASSAWGVGPFGDGPFIPSAVTDLTHARFNITTEQPPTPSCGAIALP